MIAFLILIIEKGPTYIPESRLHALLDHVSDQIQRAPAIPLANHPADEGHEGILLDDHTPCCGYEGGDSDGYNGGSSDGYTDV